MGYKHYGLNYLSDKKYIFFLIQTRKWFLPRYDQTCVFIAAAYRKGREALKDLIQRNNWLDLNNKEDRYNTNMMRACDCCSNSLITGLRRLPSERGLSGCATVPLSPCHRKLGVGYCQRGVVGAQPQGWRGDASTFWSSSVLHSSMLL